MVAGAAPDVGEAEAEGEDPKVAARSKERDRPALR